MLGIRILVIDDEPAIRRLLRAGLVTKGFVVAETTGGFAGLAALSPRTIPRHDLVILDLGLPDIDGLDVLRALRERGDLRPILILSRRDDEAEKVRAFELGADDYVTKPFGMNELIARLYTALRHRLQTQGERPLFQVKDLSVDLARRLVKRNGEEIRLSRKQYDLLRLFVKHAGKVLTHRYILEELWEPTTNAQYLRVYVQQLRLKIEHHPDRPTYILTERGIGYRLTTND